MTPWTRRSFLVAAGSGGLVACTSTPPGAGLSARDKIDRDVDAALAELYSNVPGAAELGASAQGILVIPRIRKAGFFASGSYGEGALMIGPAKVDYYSLSSARHRADLRRQRVQPGAVLHDRPGAAGLPRRRRLGARRRRGGGGAERRRGGRASPRPRSTARSTR